MYSFDVEEVTNACINWIREWFERNGKNCKAVVGISGGKDSSVVAALCVRALGKDRVVGVLMPNGVQADIKDSHQICEFLGIENYVINIHASFEALKEEIANKTQLTISEQTRVNLAPRIRMTTLYAIAQSVNGMVANTCNLSEDHVGYSTLFGDYSGSFSPLGKLSVTEVIAIGKYLGLPVNLTEKAPSDGLCGKTDEDNLGFTYAELDKYMRTGKIDNLEHKELIDTKYRRNKFKLDLIHIETFDPQLEMAIEH